MECIVYRVRRVLAVSGRRGQSWEDGHPAIGLKSPFRIVAKDGGQEAIVDITAEMVLFGAERRWKAESRAIPSGVFVVTAFQHPVRDRLERGRPVS